MASVIFLMIFPFSAWLGDFFNVTQATIIDGSREWRWIIPAGIPGLGELIAKTLPVQRWESLRADLGEWFWRWNVWLNLLVVTILIAFMATAFGVGGGLGREVREALSSQVYTDLSAHFIIIFVTVMVIDYGSEKLRHRIIGIGKGPSL